MEDLIKRADAIEAYSDIYWIDDRLNLAFREELDKIDEKIRNIPAVEIADRPQGEWIFDSEILCSDIGVYSAGYRCSVCGKDYFKVDGTLFCPNCGAHMKGADDDL